MRLVVLLSLAFTACVGSGDSPDNPNREEPGSGHPGGTARYWTVIDEASGDVLSTGCNGLPNPKIQGAVGQRLIYEIKEEIVSKEQGSLESDWWCTDEKLITRSAARLVDNLACWVLPTGAPIRVERWEAIPVERVLPDSSPSRMSGTGYRLFLEVMDFGNLVLIPKGRTCNLKERMILQVTE